MKRRRFALAGVSHRGLDMFALPIAREFSATSELVALFDISRLHMDHCNGKLPRPVPTFTDFDRMVKDVDFDTVIVCTMDSAHHEYIIKALEAGKDVISEKPMTIDDEKCRAILKAERESGRRVTVTFNYRFAPPITAIRRILAAGAIGEVRTVDMHWPLDLDHGAMYFRRWHRKMANSGGLHVHKSTHHFDLINWFLQDRPESIAAQGDLSFYGRNGPFRSPRCKGCPHKNKCQFHWDISKDDFFREFYEAAEDETGYIRDGCVFDESIDILDNYNMIVNYKGGARLSYSLQAWSPWEGFRLEMQGAKGRLEYYEVHSKHDWEDTGDRQVVVMLNDGSRIVTTPPKGIGGHGGGDSVLLEMLFGQPPEDPLGHMADSLDAAYSILVGVAATKSIQRKGEWVRIDDLLKEE